ncbi:MAG: glycosyltransferase [Acidobacteriota bacterium]
MSPLVMAGMHRSGTSLLTSLLAASGVDVGESLVPADRNNRKGYFEDTDFLALNRRILSECSDANDGGHPDWGWTESESLDTARFASYRSDAGELLRRVGREGRWGFKDPRTTLLLDFWHELFEDPRYLLVYRLPWQVSDSMQRLGADVFLRNPTYGYRIWTYYNRHLLDFYRRHRDRCLLVNSNALLGQPDGLAEDLRERLDLKLDPSAFDDLYDSSMLGASAPDDPLIGLVAATSPDVVELLAELDAEADLPATGQWKPPGRLRAPALEQAKAPEVSVVIPCKNHGQLLIEAIASVERSMPVDYELIVIDDGSDQPRTCEVFETLREAGYRIESQEPSGLSAARNRGITEARADYILPLDADNRLRPEFIAPAIAALDNGPELGVVYGEPWEFGLREGRRDVDELDIAKLLESNYIDACALTRKACWWDIGGYDEALPAWEDWDFWIRVATRGWAARKLDVIAFDYRVRPNSLVTITEQDETLEFIVDHVTAKHRQLFHGHLTQRLGHVLSTWPRALERKHQRLAESTEELRQDYAQTEEHARIVEARAQSLEASVADLRLQVERSRIERLELERSQLEEVGALERRLAALESEHTETFHGLERSARDAHLDAERAQVKAERAQVVAEREAERLAAQLEQTRLRLDKAVGESQLQSALIETQNREVATRHGEVEALHAEREVLKTAIDGLEREIHGLESEAEAEKLAAENRALRSALDEARDQVAERQRTLDAIHDSRAFGWVRMWWGLMRRVRPGRTKASAAPSVASHVSSPNAPVKDGL